MNGCFSFCRILDDSPKNAHESHKNPVQRLCRHFYLRFRMSSSWFISRKDLTKIVWINFGCQIHLLSFRDFLHLHALYSSKQSVKQSVNRIKQKFLTFCFHDGYLSVENTVFDQSPDLLIDVIVLTGTVQILVGDWFSTLKHDKYMDQ